MIGNRSRKDKNSQNCLQVNWKWSESGKGKLLTVVYRVQNGQN
jgi:hypothetical protein